MRPAATSATPSATIYWQDGRFTLSPKISGMSPPPSELVSIPLDYGIMRYRQTLTLAPETYLQAIGETIKRIVEQHEAPAARETENELQERTDKLTIALSSTFTWATQARALNADFRVVVAHAMEMPDDDDHIDALAPRRFVTLNLLPSHVGMDVFDRTPMEYPVPVGNITSHNYDAQLAGVGGYLPRSTAIDIVTLGPMRLGRRS